MGGIVKSISKAVGPLGAIFGGGQAKGGPPGTTATGVSQVEPPSYLLPFLSSTAQKSQNAYDSFISGGLNAPFTGQNLNSPVINNLVPQPTAADLAGQSTALSTAKSYAGAPDLLNSIAQGLTGPALQDTIRANLAPVEHNLTHNILPTLKSQAIADGAYGGSSFENLERNTLNDFSTNAANAATSKTLEADQLIPQLIGAGTQEGSNLAALQGGVGASQRQFTANDIAAAMGLYGGQQAQPFNGLSTLEGLLTGTAGGGSTTTGFKPTNPASQIQNALGGLGSFGGSLGSIGNGISSGLGSLGSLFGLGNGSAGMAQLSNFGLADAADATAADFAAPAAAASSTGIMDAIASAFAFLSDRRLKRNIQMVGRVALNLPLYTYYYLWSDEKQIGLMADDVELVCPQAVSVHPSGFKMVNYALVR